MRPYVAVLILLAGCATGDRGGIRQAWFEPSPYAWHATTIHGVRLNLKDGTSRHIPGKVMDNVVTVKRKLERASGVKAGLALVDTELPNAFATIHEGKPLIALSLSFLDQFGRDKDALATTIGHELAHLDLGHGGNARAERDHAGRTGAQAIGTLLSAAGVPLGGLVADLGATAITSSFTRDEERAADEAGLRWAVDAGYDPCGAARVVQVLSKLGPVNVPFLSTHPGFDERAERASRYAQQAGKSACS